MARLIATVSLMSGKNADVNRAIEPDLQVRPLLVLQPFNTPQDRFLSGFRDHEPSPTPITSASRNKQRVSQIKGVVGPIQGRTRMLDIGPIDRMAARNRVAPLQRNRLAALRCAQWRGADCRIGVSVTATPHSRTDRLGKVGAAHQAVERIVQRGQHPAHLVLIVAGSGVSWRQQALANGVGIRARTGMGVGPQPTSFPVHHRRYPQRLPPYRRRWPRGRPDADGSERHLFLPVAPRAPGRPWQRYPAG